MEQKSAFEGFELEINEDIKGFLKEISKWANFLSILGFIGLGLMVVVGVFVGFFSSLNDIGGDFAYGLGYSMGVGLFYAIIALVYFFPILYLYKFSKKIKYALAHSNNEDFKTAFKNLKSHYKFMGIFAIVIIGLYVLIFIGGMFAAALF